MAGYTAPDCEALIGRKFRRDPLGAFSSPPLYQTIFCPVLNLTTGPPSGCAGASGKRRVKGSVTLERLVSSASARSKHGYLGLEEPARLARTSPPYGGLVGSPGEVEPSHRHTESAFIGCPWTGSFSTIHGHFQALATDADVSTYKDTRAAPRRPLRQGVAHRRWTSHTQLHRSDQPRLAINTRFSGVSSRLSYRNRQGPARQPLPQVHAIRVDASTDFAGPDLRCTGK